jgi:hypothetical protein
METGAGNRSTNSFAVEFDTLQNDWYGFGIQSYPTDGPGSPSNPRTYHLGIDAGNTVDSVVQTSEDLPDIFDPAGIHARVRYNRGRVTVWLASNAAGAGPLKQYLQADVIPISFAAPDQLAVFGFTAGTGSNTETGEVDNLKVTVFGCDDPPEIAVISGRPTAPVAQGALVTLDGGGSASGPGETGGITSWRWEVLSGPAAVEGPSDQPTVNLRTGATDGAVRVRLVASDGRCSNPGVAEVSFDVGASRTGSWLRCDANGDGARDITDPVFVLARLFQGGPAPGCAGAIDCNSDGAVDVSDVVFDLAFQFQGGGPPAPPYPGCDRFPDCPSTCK